MPRESTKKTVAAPPEEDADGATIVAADATLGRSKIATNIMSRIREMRYMYSYVPSQLKPVLGDELTGLLAKLDGIDMASSYNSSTKEYSADSLYEQGFSIDILQRIADGINDIIDPIISKQRVRTPPPSKPGP